MELISIKINIYFQNQVTEMELDQQKQAQRFIEEFKQIDFQVPFENLKREVVSIEGKKYYKDLYLVDKLLPTLTEAMEALSKQLQELMNNAEQIDPQVRSRFNPCLFLGQFLMRRNHNLNLHPKTPLTQLLQDYVKIETLNRLFVTRFQTMYKMFSKSIGKDKKFCDISELKLYARDVDQTFDCKGQLKGFLSNNKALLKNKEEIKLNDILDQLTKFLALKTQYNEKDIERIISNYS